MGGAEVDSADWWVWETGVFEQDQIQEDWVQGGDARKDWARRTAVWNVGFHPEELSLLHFLLLFLARALRKALTHLEMRRAARRPNLPLKVKPPLIAVRPPVPLPAPSHPASTNEPIVLED